MSTTANSFDADKVTFIESFDARSVAKMMGNTAALMSGQPGRVEAIDTGNDACLDVGGRTAFRSSIC